MPKNLGIFWACHSMLAMQNCICFLVNNDIFYYEQMIDLTTLLLKYSCSNSKKWI